MERVYLGVGSNLGDRVGHILRAEEKIAKHFTEVKRSRLYETAPRYRTNQPFFLNAVFCGETQSAPEELLSYIHKIEMDAGRDRGASGWMGPRPIDIDILLYGEKSIQTPRLTIPHPRMTERGFVLIPLLELDPFLKDPVTGDKYASIAASLPHQGIYYHTVMPL